jgi:streptogramin lyase
MHRKVLAVVALFIGTLLVSTAVRMTAQSSPAALTGIVRAQADPESPAARAGTLGTPVEGVVVSAKRDGSTVTVSVVSDAQGRFTFPPDRLEPGAHAVRIRATGYEIDGPATVNVTAGMNSPFDVKLRKTQDLAAQLTNGEWFMSWPGSNEIKFGLLNCTQCHSLQPVVRSTYTAEQWVPVINRMARYAQGSTPARPQLRPGRGTGSAILAQSMAGREGERPVPAELVKQTAEYLASINLSAGSTWRYPLKTYPRPSGASTRVIVTEYDLPRPETLPHDAVADEHGMIWYGDFGTHVLGVLDPKTGKVVEYPMPITKPGAPGGSLDVVLDKQGNVWMGTMYQGSLAKFDRRTKTFQTWGSPTFRERDNARIAMVMPINHDVDGQVWIGGDNEYQVDVKTGEWKTVDYSVGLPRDSKILRELSSYGVASDSKNNFYGLNLNATYIIRVDAQTKQVTPFPTPAPNSGPRRGHMDAEDRLWFAEFRANKIGMFDTKTEKFQEWPVPTPWANVYDAIADKAGFAWAGGMNNDRIVRVNTKTGATVEYLLPNGTNVRRVNVDNSTSTPSFWIGNNLGATLVRVEPLE